MQKRQIPRPVKIWHCQEVGVGSLSALSRAGQAWERMEGELAEKIFLGGTGPGGAWCGVGCQRASSAISVGQDRCSSGKHQRPGTLLLSPHHGPLHNSLFLALLQPPSLPLVCISSEGPPWEASLLPRKGSLGSCPSQISLLPCSNTPSLALVF